MNLTKTLQDYFTELSSPEFSLEGCNVAAMTSVLSINLAMKICNLQLKNVDEDDEVEISGIRSKLLLFHTEMLSLAFKKIPLPTEFEDQANGSSDMMDAIIIPVSILEKLKELVPLLSKLVSICDKIFLSELGITLSLASASAESSYSKLVGSSTFLNNQTIANEFTKKAEVLSKEIKSDVKKILSFIQKRITKL